MPKRIQRKRMKGWRTDPAKSEIERYVVDYNGCVMSARKGTWVRYDDHLAALTAARESWEREREAAQLAADVNREFRDSAELRRRVERLRDELIDAINNRKFAAVADQQFPEAATFRDCADLAKKMLSNKSIMAALTAKEGM